MDKAPVKMNMNMDKGPVNNMIATRTVKIKAAKTVPVRNTGNNKARFSIALHACLMLYVNTHGHFQTEF